jgi:phosphosulfolactate synthase
MDFLDVEERPTKPRQDGITHVLDSGLGTGLIEDSLSQFGEYVDIVKLGWGTGYITDNLAEKIDLYRSYDVDVYFGGTLFELSFLKDSLDGFVSCMKDLGVKHVEVSTGILSIDHDRKCEFIEELSEEFTVFSEIGRKDPDNVMPPQEWISQSKKELEAGAWKIITEGRASGKTGIYRRDGEVRFGLVDEILDTIDKSDLLFEAPNKEQQLWFIEKMGPSVNLGNVAMDEVLALETLRLGLRGDTVEMIHGGKNGN